MMAKAIYNEALNIKKQRLETAVSRLNSVSDSVGKSSEIDTKINELVNQLQVIDAGGGEPDETDVATVIEKVIGWIYVSPEVVRRLEA